MNSNVREQLREKAMKLKTAPEKAEVESDNAIIAKNSADIKYDLSWFLSNNWISETATNNKTIKSIDSCGASVWLAADGEIWYRTSLEEIPVKAPASRARLVLGNMIKKKMKLINGNDEHPADITELDLLLVVKDIFDPFKREEFFESRNAYYRNTFRPTKYMMVKPQRLPESSSILSLIKHLSGEDHFDWVMNWMAQFFQTLKKSQVSLVMRGAQGAGKGILWSEIIQPLFGREQTIQVNDKALETNFLGGIVERRIFYNLDEISHNIASSKKIKNFLKALVTNPSIIAEKKNKNIESETPLFGQILITSNEPYVVEVEPGDRRFTVLMTGEKLSKINYLGHGGYEALSAAIKEEMPYFANYLKRYPIDTELANTALETKEKTALINATNDKFTMFANAIKKRDMAFFIDLEDDNLILYDEIREDFEKGRICQPKIRIYFKELFDEDITAKRLMDRLRAIYPALFDNNSIIKSNGRKYFKLE